MDRIHDLLHSPRPSISSQGRPSLQEPARPRAGSTLQQLSSLSSYPTASARPLEAITDADKICENDEFFAFFCDRVMERSKPEQIPFRAALLSLGKCIYQMMHFGFNTQGALSEKKEDLVKQFFQKGSPLLSLFNDEECEKLREFSKEDVSFFIDVTKRVKAALLTLHSEQTQKRGIFSRTKSTPNIKKQVSQSTEDAPSDERFKQFLALLDDPAKKQEFAEALNKKYKLGPPFFALRETLYQIRTHSFEFSNLKEAIEKVEIPEIVMDQFSDNAELTAIFALIQTRKEKGFSTPTLFMQLEKKVLDYLYRNFYLKLYNEQGQYDSINLTQALAVESVNKERTRRKAELFQLFAPSSKKQMLRSQSDLPPNTSPTIFVLEHPTKRAQLTKLLTQKKHPELALFLDSFFSFDPYDSNNRHSATVTLNNFQRDFTRLFYPPGCRLSSQELGEQFHQQHEFIDAMNNIFYSTSKNEFKRVKAKISARVEKLLTSQEIELILKSEQ